MRAVQTGLLDHLHSLRVQQNSWEKMVQTYITLSLSLSLSLTVFFMYPDFHADTAYETMVEDETMIDQESMPWFNPAYRAAGPKQEKEKPQPPESIDVSQDNKLYEFTVTLLSRPMSPIQTTQCPNKAPLCYHQLIVL